jgi:AraC-like DNA-binding protein
VSRINPAQIQTREDLIRQLEELFHRDTRSIKRLAQAAGLSPATLHGMINGGTNLPRASTLEAFVKECGQDPAPWLAARTRVLRGEGQEVRHSAAAPSRRLRIRGPWRELLEPELTIVVGVFGVMDEPAGLMGAGCAFGLIELLRHLDQIGARQPKIIKIASGDQVTDDFRRNTLILIGGPARNTVTRDAMRRLPLTHHFAEPVTTIRDAQTGRTYRYSPTLFGPADGTDYGLLIKARNPFNPRTSILVIAGSSGYGSWAGTRLITEPSALDETAASGDSFECVFATDVLDRNPQATEALVIRKLNERQQRA